MPSIEFLKDKQHYTLKGLADKSLVCAFSSRQAGNMSFFYGETKDALDNRSYFLDEIGIDYKGLVCAKQVHASAIKYAKTSDRGKGALFYEDSLAATDAFVTGEKNLPLAVFSADCLPVFLYDPKNAACAIIHAGWRSTKENITGKTILFMREVLKTKAHELRLILGPSIRNCCYEVGHRFKGIFHQGAIARGGKYYLDLPKINKEQAVASGVFASKIFDPAICTSCQNNYFFSYRKEGKNCGRMISVIMLK